MLQGKTVRVARSTDRLNEVVRFENHEGFDGVMVGIPGESYHC